MFPHRLIGFRTRRSKATNVGNDVFGVWGLFSLFCCFAVGVDVDGRQRSIYAVCFCRWLTCNPVVVVSESFVTGSRAKKFTLVSFPWTVVVCTAAFFCPTSDLKLLIKTFTRPAYSLVLVFLSLSSCTHQKNKTPLLHDPSRLILPRACFFV